MNILKHILSYLFEDEIEFYYSFRKASFRDKIKISFILLFIFLLGIIAGISYLLSYIPIINWIFSLKLVLRIIAIIEKISNQIFRIIKMVNN